MDSFDKSNLRLREVTDKDRDLLYHWANDPTVRINAFSTAEIPYEDHVKWFIEKMNDQNTLMYILMRGDQPIGQIRFAVDGQEAVISYSIAKDERGKGYGKQMLSLAEEELSKHYPHVIKLVAQVKQGNMASKGVFLGNGYQETYTVYEKKLQDV